MEGIDSSIPSITNPCPLIKFMRSHMIIYVHSKCSTCQKALGFLKENHLQVTVKDIVEYPPTMDELQKMLEFHQGNTTKLLNTSGILYREMKLSQKLKEMSQSEILKLLHGNGMLIKRPFLLAKDFGLTGFKELEWAQELL
jgi:arsenate reductase